MSVTNNIPRKTREERAPCLFAPHAKAERQNETQRPADSEQNLGNKYRRTLMTRDMIWNQRGHIALTRTPFSDSDHRAFHQGQHIATLQSDRKLARTAGPNYWRRGLELIAEPSVYTLSCLSCSCCCQMSFPMRIKSCCTALYLL